VLQFCKSLVLGNQKHVGKGHIEENIMVAATIANASIFLGRVTADACPDNVTLWASQACNPVAKCHSFPNDAALLLFLPTTILQFTTRGISFSYVIIAYLIKTFLYIFL
jgi:hypothetical protein